MLGLVLSVLCCVLYVVETAFQIHIAMNSTSTDLVIILSFVAAPLFITNIISAVLVFRTMDFTGKGSARLICIILHSLQVGLLWRSLKLLMLFDQHDWRDFVILRLIQTALQSFPISIFKGSHFFNGLDMSVEVILLVVISIISSSIVYSMYNTESALFDIDEFSGFSTRIRKPFGVVVMTLGTILLLFSRCGSIMLLFSLEPLLVPIPLFIHFILYFLSSTFYHFFRKKGSLIQVLKSLALAFLNLFDILNKDNQKLACENVLLYSSILVQNVIMTGYWMLNNDWNYRHQLSTTISIILTFVCGMFLKCCSCTYLQNDKFEPFSEAVFQLAIEISTKDRNEQRSIEIQNHEKYLEYENHCSTISVKNGYIHKHDKTHSSGRTNTDVSTKLKTGGVNFDKQVKSDSVRKKRNNGSNMELASSNSRNTNTLNTSDPMNNPEIAPSVKQIRRNNSTEPKSPSKHRKSPLPLFPNECSNYLPNRTFESKHVLSNSTDNGSVTSYSEYASYSYYTDWSSCDSECTWSDQMTFINLHTLPTEKVSTTDSVQIWLSKLSEWDPLHDSLEDEFHDSLEGPQTHSNEMIKDIHSNSYCKENSKESNIILRPKDAFNQFCNIQKESSKQSYLPYNLSDYEKTRQLSNENPLMIGRDQDETPITTIQESMV